MLPFSTIFAAYDSQTVAAMEVDHETLHKTSSEGEIVEQDKKPSAMHTRLADIPGPPSASPDPKTVDIIKYYKQARVDHDFKLIEVSSLFALIPAIYALLISTLKRHYFRAFGATRSLETPTF